MFYNWLLATWSVISQSAPWLLLGFFLAGVLHVLIPAEFIARHLQKRGFASVFKASMIGVPLPLCSCSVIPVATALRRKGASRGATAAFFVSTPEIGVDSFLLSYSLLGSFLAFARMIASFVSAMIVGLLINLFEGDDRPEPAIASAAPACCAHGKEKVPRSMLEKLLGIFHFGFIDLIDDLAPLLMFGFLAAGLITVLVPDNFFSGLNANASMFLMLLVSFPLYICAASSTPLAAALLAKGLAPGAVVVFLLAGPASNITTMAAIARELGRKEIVIYIIGVSVVSLLFGAGINELALRGYKVFDLTSGVGMVHEHASFWTGLILLWLMSVSLFRRLKK